jgi:hypothetical protein
VDVQNRYSDLVRETECNFRRRRRRIYYTDVVPQLELPVYFGRYAALALDST